MKVWFKPVLGVLRTENHLKSTTEHDPNRLPRLKKSLTESPVERLQQVATIFHFRIFTDPSPLHKIQKLPPTGYALMLYPQNGWVHCKKRPNRLYTIFGLGRSSFQLPTPFGLSSALHSSVGATGLWTHLMASKPVTAGNIAFNAEKWHVSFIFERSRHPNSSKKCSFNHQSSKIGLNP